MNVQLFNSILLTLPRQTTGSGGRSPADAVLDLAKDITGKLPASYNMEAVSFLYVDGGLSLRSGDSQYEF